MQIKIDPEQIKDLKKRIEAEATTGLMGLGGPAGLITEGFFQLVKYTDKISKTFVLGQPHILLKGGTGIGKTDLCQSAAAAIKGKFSRISCTPDMMPYDLLGGQVLVKNRKGERRVQFKPGPLFANIVLLDEANRAQPKTMSAVLEAMEERSVSPRTEYIDDDEQVVGTLPLFPISGEYGDFKSPLFFMVLMTENIFGEEEGTYPTPMGVLDRVTFTVSIPRPSFEDEKRIRADQIVGKSIKEVADLKEILACADWIFHHVEFSEAAYHYRTLLIRNTDPDPKINEPNSEIGQHLSAYVRVGDSPRANLHLEAVARTHAFFAGSMVVKPEHIKAVAKSVLMHRLVLKPGKEFKTTKEEVFEKILKMTGQPEWK